VRLKVQVFSGKTKLYDLTNRLHVSATILHPNIRPIPRM
jgi:hypothetical protein